MKELDRGSKSSGERQLGGGSLISHSHAIVRGFALPSVQPCCGHPAGIFQFRG